MFHATNGRPDVPSVFSQRSAVLRRLTAIATGIGVRLTGSETTGAGKIGVRPVGTAETSGNDPPNIGAIIHDGGVDFAA